MDTGQEKERKRKREKSEGGKKEGGWRDKKARLKKKCMGMDGLQCFSEVLRYVSCLVFVFVFKHACHAMYHVCASQKSRVGLKYGERPWIGSIGMLRPGTLPTRPSTIVRVRVTLNDQSAL